jgi:Ca2+-binding RTX toxin-like protein
VVTGTGNTVIDATAAEAGAAITTEGSATLDLTTGGNATLNAGDDFLTVSLATATNLTLSPLSFITAIAGPGADTITALAAEQTLVGGSGIDTLIGYAGFGDLFLGTAGSLNADTIQYFGGNDLIDLTNIARAGAVLAYSGSATNGTLSVSGGGLTTSISLSSGTNLAQSRFHMTSDGHGGTNIALI